MRIAEEAAKCSLSVDTIRYYEKAGICPSIERGPDGNRRFSPENLDWLNLLAALRETGMPTKKMKYFADLYRQGDAKAAERKKVLKQHEMHLDLQQARLTKCKALLRHKLALYDQILGVKT